MNNKEELDYLINKLMTCNDERKMKIIYVFVSVLLEQQNYPTQK